MRFALGVALLSIATFAAADQSVYSTKFDNGWQNWSWAKTGLTGKSIAVKSGAWQAVYLHHDKQKGSSYSAITFNIKGDTWAGKKVQVLATIDGKVPKGYFYVITLSKGWEKVSVPTSKLGIANGTFDGFWIQAQDEERYSLSGIALKSK